MTHERLKIVLQTTTCQIVPISLCSPNHLLTLPLYMSFRHQLFNRILQAKSLYEFFELLVTLARLSINQVLLPCFDPRS